MKQLDIYLVGGAVRDTLLGLSISDRDYVVVGATPQEMLDRGFTQVGADFPVFLHPKTSEEYALARTERRTSSGYLGFSTSTESVTLEEDLSRRDLTINAMAMDEQGVVTDPYNGRADLQNKQLRHVSDAFREDPVRILRIGRFLARYGEQWSVAPETLALVKDMVEQGDAKTLQAERVWKELSRGLMEPFPLLMLGFWETVGLFEQQSFQDYGLREVAIRHELLSKESVHTEPLEVRVTLAFSRLSGGSKAPASCLQVSQALRRLLATQAAATDPESRFSTLEGIDAIRQPDRAKHIIAAMRYFDFDLARQIEQDLAAVLRLDVKSISAAMPKGPEVGAAIRKARVEALAEVAAAPKN